MTNSTSALSQELYDAIFDMGCMYHKDDGQCPTFPSVAYYRVEGDVWCQAGLTACLRDGVQVTAKPV